MASTTGFLNVNGLDLSNLYYSTSNLVIPSTFSGSNTFNGLINHRLTTITTAGTYTYTSSNVPNFIGITGLGLNVTFNLPTTGVPDGFILHVRKNNGASQQTYSFTPNIFNLSNTSVSNIVTTAYSFSLIKYSSNWYLHVLSIQ